MGTDLVDVPAATARGIAVVVTPGSMRRAAAVAEGAIGMALHLAKRFGPRSRAGARGALGAARRSRSGTSTAPPWVWSATAASKPAHRDAGGRLRDAGPGLPRSGERAARRRTLR